MVEIEILVVLLLFCLNGVFLANFFFCPHVKSTTKHAGLWPRFTKMQLYLIYSHFFQKRGYRFTYSRVLKTQLYVKSIAAFFRLDIAAFL